VSFDVGSGFFFCELGGFTLSALLFVREEKAGLDGRAGEGTVDVCAGLAAKGTGGGEIGVVVAG
jgi:hypothetical protein